MKKIDLFSSQFESWKSKQQDTGSNKDFPWLCLVIEDGIMEGVYVSWRDHVLGQEAKRSEKLG